MNAPAQRPLFASTVSALLAAACAGGIGTGMVAGCSSSSSGGGSTGASSPCDPLTPSAITLGTILGVGKDQSTLYLADIAPGTGSPSGQDRVFVSSGKTLERQHVAGTGQQGSPPNASYTLSFEPAYADASALRSLLIQESGGKVTGMQVGPDSPKSFGPGPGDQPLTVLDSSAISGFAIHDLPVVVAYLADVSNGDTLVVVSPMDAYDSSDSRLFYGRSAQMVERVITAYNADCCGTNISFDVGAVSYTASFTWMTGDGGGGPGPATLDTGSGMLGMTERLPVPQTLSGFAFSCL